jgi:hypothetical protein
MFVLKQLSRSTLAGTERRFGAGTVRLGRDPAGDVVYDAVADAVVSDRHAELTYADGEVTIVDLASSNGTYVNGRRIIPGDPRRLSGDDVVELGGDVGPSLRVLREGDVRPDTRPVLPLPKEGEDAPGSGIVGRATLRRVVADITKKERRRAAGVLSAVLLVVAAGGYVVLTNRPRDTLRETRVETIVEPETVPEPDRGERLSAALAAARGAVYVVMQRGGAAGGDLSDRPFGTAWSVAPGLLATNGHVAQELERLSAGATFVARNGDSPPVDLRLVGYRIHPGYEEYRKLRERYTRGVDLDLFYALKGGCDVALLTVDPADAEKQAPPLLLATDGELRELRTNTPVGYVGFPMEGRGLNRERPTPIVSTGAVTSLSDFFLGAAPFERAQLVAMDAEGGGGASGSPTIGPDGRVVCMLHAVDLQNVQGRRLKAAGGQTYGQRVDLLRELLDGAAEAAQPARTEAWRTEFEALYASAVREIFRLVRVDAARKLAMSGVLATPPKELEDAWEEVHSEAIVVAKGGPDGEVVVEFEAAAAGPHLVAAVPLSEPVDIDIPTTHRAGLRDVGEDAFPYVIDRVAAGAKFRVVVRAAPPTLERPLEVRVKAYRLK